ncbi:MAG: hypothetical protein VX589_05190 [Myxococcota bacterium]|nr:hypothetical protein [Myxococcota bacterium]
MYTRILLAFVVSSVFACSQLGEDNPSSNQIEKESSYHATFIEMSFNGRIIASHAWSPERTIEQQLLYTVGQLNGVRAVGRLDRVDIKDLNVSGESGRYVIDYTASMPVAWGTSNPVPDEYELILPIDMTYQQQTAFTDKYKTRCVSYSAHDVDSGSMWYYYRPNRSGCTIDDADVYRTSASIAPSVLQTEGKYPEYHEVWKDNRLEVVAIFGRADENKPAESDIGTRNFRIFVSKINELIPSDTITMTPANPSGTLGVDTTEVQITGEIGPGRTVQVTVLVVDNVRTAGPAFNRRYRELTPSADLVIYNGHAGLGENIRALAARGDWRPEQYVIVYMNGCDTYAYVDDALFAAHRAVNPSDPTGTRFVDLVANAMPAYFFDMTGASMALVNALASPDTPATYDEIFAKIARQQIVLVTGEDDNIYEPGYEPAPTTANDGPEPSPATEPEPAPSDEPQPYPADAPE